MDPMEAARSMSGGSPRKAEPEAPAELAEQRSEKPETNLLSGLLAEADRMAESLCGMPEQMKGAGGVNLAPSDGQRAPRWMRDDSPETRTLMNAGAKMGVAIGGGYDVKIVTNKSTSRTSIEAAIGCAKVFPLRVCGDQFPFMTLDARGDNGGPAKYLLRCVLRDQADIGNLDVRDYGNVFEFGSVNSGLLTALGEIERMWQGRPIPEKAEAEVAVNLAVTMPWSKTQSRSESQELADELMSERMRFARGSAAAFMALIHAMLTKPDDETVDWQEIARICLRRV